MEAFGALFDEEYESLTKMFDNINPDFFLHESSIFPTYFNSCSQESSNSTGIDTSALFAIGDHGNQHDHQPYNNGAVNSLRDHITNNMFESMSFYDGYNFPDNVMGDILSSNVEISYTNQNMGPEKEIQLKRKYEVESARNQDRDIRPLEDKSQNVSPESRKKKARTSRNVEKSKSKKKVIEDKNNNIEVGINNNDIGNRKQSLVSGSSSDQDDNISNGSKEVINGEGSVGSTGLNSDGKARASRGSATDPQSLYARRRRERISERLRILQNLVPNGTKVDISTMLEEAVHYVKFLQLQIKLLSSDEMWMYAPIAYNGMDLSMFQKISPL